MLWMKLNLCHKFNLFSYIKGHTIILKKTSKYARMGLKASFNNNNNHSQTDSQWLTKMTWQQLQLNFSLATIIDYFETPFKNFITADFLTILVDRVLLLFQRE